MQRQLFGTELLAVKHSTGQVCLNRRLKPFWKRKNSDFKPCCLADVSHCGKHIRRYPRGGLRSGAANGGLMSIHGLLPSGYPFQLALKETAMLLPLKSPRLLASMTKSVSSSPSVQNDGTFFSSNH